MPNTHIQDRRAYLSDPDGIIGASEAGAINRTAGELERALGVEAALVVVGSIGDAEPRDFANKLFKRWGIGKAGKDNGLLILLVSDPKGRSVTFETGYGLESLLPDIICYRIQQQYMIPDMREGRYGAGLLKGLQATAQYLGRNLGQDSDTEGGQEQSRPSTVGRVAAQDRQPPPPGQARHIPSGPAVAPAETSFAEDLTDAFTALFVIGIIVFLTIITRGRFLTVLLRIVLLLLSSGGRGGRGGGGGFGGGFGGGGGGSWGGGRSGGGGASSRF